MAQGEAELRFELEADAARAYCEILFHIALRLTVRSLTETVIHARKIEPPVPSSKLPSRPN